MISVSFTKVTFGYRPHSPIFRNLSLQLEAAVIRGKGRLIAIMGQSGSGKTTLLRLIAGVEVPTHGTVTFSPDRARISYLQQDPILFEHLSRKENARYFEMIHNTRAQFDEATFIRLAKQLRLVDVLEASGRIDEMSGGEHQRLSLLRALSIQPQIILLDEPCSGLDVGVKLEFLHMLRQAVDDFGLLALYVTHHAEEAALVADDLLYLTGSSTNSGVAARLTSIGEALKNPSNIEAAQASMTPAGNVIYCKSDQFGTLETLDKHFLAKISYPPTLVPGDYAIVFPPDTVEWSNDGNQELDVVGRSAKYLFVKGRHDLKIFGPLVNFGPKSFVLNGNVIAFKDRQGTGTIINVNGGGL